MSACPWENAVCFSAASRLPVLFIFRRLMNCMQISCPMLGLLLTCQPSDLLTTPLHHAACPRTDLQEPQQEFPWLLLGVVWQGWEGEEEGTRRMKAGTKALSPPHLLPYGAAWTRLYLLGEQLLCAVPASGLRQPLSPLPGVRLRGEHGCHEAGALLTHSLVGSLYVKKPPRMILM